MNFSENIAQNFTITGLLDKNSETRKRFPIEELPVQDIESHPENIAYSMDVPSIEALANSIKRDGLTDLPLVRKLDNGHFQMLSGHRRCAAYALLAQTDPGFEKLPCRIIEGLTDAQALILLHTANYFVRELTITERAAATRALGIQIEQMREDTPELIGMRTRDLKAQIVSEQTGRKVSGKSIERQEALADIIENKLSLGWQKLANENLLSSSSIQLLANLPERTQAKLHVLWTEDGGYNKRDTTDFIRRHTSKSTEADARLRRADKEIQKYIAHHSLPLSAADKALIDALARHIEALKTQAQAS